MSRPKITLVLDNIRSAYNVGAIFRSADVFEVAEIILTGISPYPAIKNDPRLPHIRDKATHMIAKTALGAEKIVPFRYLNRLEQAIEWLHTAAVPVYALEQSPQSITIVNFNPPDKLALILGPEVTGLDPLVLQQCQATLEIPQYGTKESLNVAVAAGIALYELSKPSNK